nr:hypothetical protein [Oceanococcus sp. HetDA_MAG_MS8]
MLVYLCNLDGADEARINVNGSIFNPDNRTVPTCENGQWFDTSVLVDAAAQFEFSQIDPVVIAQFFGSGFVLVVMFHVISILGSSIVNLTKHW